MTDLDFLLVSIADQQLYGFTAGELRCRLPVSTARNGAGEPIVWVHADPERFEPRRVRPEPLGADSVAVREGLKPGERVVTSGAALLSQVR